MIEPQPGTELPSRKAEAPPRPSSQASRIQSQAGKAPPAPCWASPGHSDGEGVWTPDERAARTVERACCPSERWSPSDSRAGRRSLESLGDDTGLLRGPSLQPRAARVGGRLVSPSPGLRPCHIAGVGRRLGNVETHPPPASPPRPHGSEQACRVLRSGTSGGGTFRARALREPREACLLQFSRCPLRSPVGRIPVPRMGELRLGQSWPRPRAWWSGGLRQVSESGA